MKEKFQMRWTILVFPIRGCRAPEPYSNLSILLKMFFPKQQSVKIWACTDDDDDDDDDDDQRGNELTGRGIEKEVDPR